MISVYREVHSEKREKGADSFRKIENTTTKSRVSKRLRRPPLPDGRGSVLRENVGHAERAVLGGAKQGA